MLNFDRELCPSEYLVTQKDFDDVKFQWRVSSEVPLKISVSVAGGIIIATKEREIWCTDSDGNDKAVWGVSFYARGDKKPFFWFSKGSDKIGDLEIKHLNRNLIKRIGEVKWKTLRN